MAIGKLSPVSSVASLRRREFLTETLASFGSLALMNQVLGNSPKNFMHGTSDRMTLGFSTYGMKSLRTETAIGHLSRIGFDAVELTVWPEWDASPEHMSTPRRARIRKQLADSGLRLTSLMEHVIPSADDAEQSRHVMRLHRVCQLANDLGREDRPIVQTVLGGGKWEDKRSMLRDRIGEWLETAASHRVVLAIKPHRGGVMSRPSEAVWLIEQLGKSNFLRIVYDYSHYAFRGMELADTVATALPYLAHVAVKDAVQEAGRVVFRLPGAAGTIPYAQLLRLLDEGGYRGDINCEVSGMVWKQPSYDPVAAAEHCYAVLSNAFTEAGISRPG